MIQLTSVFVVIVVIILNLFFWSFGFMKFIIIYKIIKKVYEQGAKFD